MTPANIAPFLLLFCLLTPSGGCAHGGLSLWDVSAGKPVSLDAALPGLKSAEVVLVGEQHDHAGHHAAQLQVILALHQAGKPVAVALEMFEHRSQSILDAWVAGRMDERTFVPHFRANWGETWPLYRDIFIACRDRKIPMVGVNVPREITSQVARSGFASLRPDQLGLLPAVTCRVDPEYLELMRQAHGHGLGDDAFTRFCEAQLVWDASMAAYSLDYLGKNPDRTVILLTGSVHAWKKGIPAQLQQLSPKTRVKVLLPETSGRFQKSNVTQEDADYLILVP
jgi:uncharacterized iron-regulated protein